MYCAGLLLRLVSFRLRQDCAGYETCASFQLLDCCRINGYSVAGMVSVSPMHVKVDTQIESLL